MFSVTGAHCVLRYRCTLCSPLQVFQCGAIHLFLLPKIIATFGLTLVDVLRWMYYNEEVNYFPFGFNPKWLSSLFPLIIALVFLTDIELMT